MVRVHNKLLSVAALAALAVLLVARSASSAPPPPRFWDFRMENQTGVVVTDISIELYAADAGKEFDALEDDPITVTVSRLPAGKTFMLGSDVGNVGLYGIAKIVVRAECPNGKSLSKPAAILATKGTYDPNVKHEVYSGFCMEAPTGKTPHKLGVAFRKNTAGDFEAWLHAHSRWDDYWSGLIENVAAFSK